MKYCDIAEYVKIVIIILSIIIVYCFVCPYLISSKNDGFVILGICLIFIEIPIVLISMRKEIKFILKFILKFIKGLKS